MITPDQCEVCRNIRIDCMCKVAPKAGERRAQIAKLDRIGNLVANLAHPKGDHLDNPLEDEAHDLLRELRMELSSPPAAPRGAVEREQILDWLRRIRTAKSFARGEADLCAVANEMEAACNPTTADYYDPVPPTDSPLRPAYTLAMAQLEESRDQWKARAEELMHADAARPRSAHRQEFAENIVRDLADGLIDEKRLRSQARIWVEQNPEQAEASRSSRPS